MIPFAYVVRYKGHLCAAVKSGLARKPLLFLAKKGEAPFIVEIAGIHSQAESEARLECARAIKRTQWAYRRTKDEPMFAGAETVERLRQLLASGPVSRRGKRWKICPIEKETCNLLNNYESSLHAKGEPEAATPQHHEQLNVTEP